MKKLLLLLVLAGVMAAFLCAWGYKTLTAKPEIGEPVVFVINKGDGLDKIAQTLYENRIITHKWQFALYARAVRLYPKVKAGEYEIANGVSLLQLSDILASGKLYHRRITIPEGLTSAEIAQLLDENEFLTGGYDDFAEGEILPETYTFSRGDTRANIVRKAKQAMEQVLEQAWNERDDGLPLKSKEELLILASIVEKETGINSERGQVASVFVNRLKNGMLLQTDPTVIYAITLGKTPLNRPLYRKDLRIDSPYNTYKYAGLPPKPICNPGKEAIWAVAHPDKTPYFYFVASGTGGHNFATSLKEHNNNVRKWRQISKNQ